MKIVLLRILGYLLVPFLFSLVFAHILGPLFAVSMLAAAIMWWGFGIAWAGSYLSVAWIVYVGLAIFTFAFLTTFSFQNCCVGMQRFRDHLVHRGWGGVFEDLVGAIIWPWVWFALDRNLRGWYMTFMDAVLNALEFWFVSSWRGSTLTYIDMQTGESTTTRLSTPEEVQSAIRDAIAKDIPKRD